MRLTRTHRSADSLVRAFQTPLPDSRTRLSALRRRSAFTLVEIAISMAIIGFAVVAIIGVLPLGLNVQKDNREETIINNEANFFMDAIRSGARGLDDLTNHVYAITNFWTKYNTTTDPWTPINSGGDGFVYTDSDVNSFPAKPFWPITNGAAIVGVLSTPKFTGNQSNYVVAYTYAMSGSAGEQLPQTQANIQNFAFAHRMIVEIYPVPNADANSPSGGKLVNNLHEVRLTFRWPLYANGKSGSGRQTYRTIAGGRLLPAPPPSPPLHWFFHPEQYSQAQ
ncbi:MAG: type II secretion system protein [Verrucomicrobia bacterium]|nr:type II secretion system protein [Verrucomicrobiota bacterium]